MIVKFWLLVVLAFVVGCQEKILHDLNELDANRVHSRLFQAAIVSKKVLEKEGVWAISVQDKDVASAIKLIEESRILKNQIPLKSSSSLLSSEQEQQLKYQTTLAKQMELTFDSLPGTLEAHVHFNLGSTSSLWRTKSSINTPASAAVLLIVAKHFSMSENEIRRLVNGASGVLQENISVVINYPPLVEVSSANVAVTNNDLNPTELQTHSWTSLIKENFNLISAKQLVLIALVSTFIGLLLQYSQYRRVRTFQKKLVTF